MAWDIANDGPFNEPTLRTVAGQQGAIDAVAWMDPKTGNVIKAGGHMAGNATWRRVYTTPLYASPQPANPAQVTDKRAAWLAESKYDALIEEAKDFSGRMTSQPWACELIERLLDALTAAIGAGGQAVEVCERIADTVLEWMVKHNFLDADNEYNENDILEVLKDLAPALSIAPATADGWRLVPYLWQCKDYADGWLSYANEDEAQAYQRDTGCAVRITYRPLPTAPTAMGGR